VVSTKMIVIIKVYQKSENDPKTLLFTVDFNYHLEGRLKITNQGHTSLPYK
jgi:hypothetical protein